MTVLARFGKNVENFVKSPSIFISAVQSELKDNPYQNTWPAFGEIDKYLFIKSFRHNSNFFWGPPCWFHSDNLQYRHKLNDTPNPQQNKNYVTKQVGNKILEIIC